mgnify:CR=1 FL=1
MFEIGGVDEATAKEALRLAIQKLLSSARSLPRNRRWLNNEAVEIRELSSDDLTVKLKEARAELFNLRFQMATSQLDNTARVKQVKKALRVFRPKCAPARSPLPAH